MLIWPWWRHRKEESNRIQQDNDHSSVHRVYTHACCSLIEPTSFEMHSTVTYPWLQSSTRHGAHVLLLHHTQTGVVFIFTLQSYLVALGSQAVQLATWNSHSEATYHPRRLFQMTELSHMSSMNGLVLSPKVQIILFHNVLKILYRTYHCTKAINISHC